MLMTTITTTMQNLGEGTSAQDVPAVPLSTAAMTATLASAATTAAATLSMVSMPTVTMMAMAGYDATLAPPPFRGNTEDDGEESLVSGILPVGSPVGNITGKFRTLD